MARVFSYSGRHAKISLEFTDKQGFLEHLSVKPRSKRLKSYGQTTIFDHFVRNRHFSGRPFTDIMPIFSDLSVNNREYTKCRPKKKLFSKNSFFLLAIKQRIGMITVIRVSVAGKLKRTSVFQIHDLDHLQNRITFFSFQIVDVFLRCFLC